MFLRLWLYFGKKKKTMVIPHYPISSEVTFFEKQFVSIFTVQPGEVEVAPWNCEEDEGHLGNFRRESRTLFVH